MRKISFLLILLCSIQLLFSQGDSLTLVGQVIGDCKLDKLTLRNFSMTNSRSTPLPINAYGLFTVKLPKAIGQYMLTAPGLRLDFLVTPEESTYRFALKCKEDGQFQITLQDSKENEAYEVMSKLERQLIEDCNTVVNYKLSSDSTHMLLESLFTAHNYNMGQIRNAYPNTFTGTVLARANVLPLGLPQKNYVSLFAWNALKNETWNNEALYKTDMPIALFSLVRIMSSKSEVDKDSAVTALLNATPTEKNAAWYFQQALYEYLFNKLDETPLIAYARWGKQHPDKIPNAVLQTKLNALEKILSGNPFINVQLKDSTGAERSLADVVAKNNFTLVMFWSPDCSHCREEMPQVAELYKAQRAKGFEVFAVAIDADADKWKSFIAQNTPGWVNVIAPADQSAAIGNSYVISYTPTFVLIDKQGIIRSRFGSLVDVMGLLGEAK